MPRSLHTERHLRGAGRRTMLRCRRRNHRWRVRTRRTRIFIRLFVCRSGWRASTGNFHRLGLLKNIFINKFFFPSVQCWQISAVPREEHSLLRNWSLQRETDAWVQPAHHNATSHRFDAKGVLRHTLRRAIRLDALLRGDLHAYHPRRIHHTQAARK